MREEGYVHDVEVITAGSYLDGEHLTGATTLKIMDAADFNEEGGSLILDGVTLDYLSADLEADTLTLASPLAADCEDATPLDVSPLTYEKRATVVLDGYDESLSAVIPHTLYDRLAEGMREDFNRESVTLELKGNTWYVDNVYGIEPVIDGQYLENVVADDVIDNIITEVKLANEAVSAAKLAANSVTETKIANDAVTTPKLVAGAVQTDKLAAGSVVADKIASAAITTAKLDALAVTSDKIAANAITASKIAAGEITASKLDVNALIGKTAQSANFVNDPEQGIIGWQFNADGSAYLRSATIGNDLFSISPTGDAAFQSLSVASVDLAGDDLYEMINRLPRGIVRTYTLSNTRAITATSGTLLGRMIIPNTESRQYAILMDNIRLDRAGTTPQWMAFRIHGNYGSAASTSSTMLHEFQVGGGTVNGSDEVFSAEHVFSVPDANVGQDLHLAMYFSSNITGMNIEGDGASRIVIKDLGAKAPQSDIDLSAGAPAVNTYTKEYASSWGASWSANFGKRTDGKCYQGNYTSGTQGNNYSKYGFSTAIQTDLSGATVKKVELYLDNNHFYSNSGGNAIIGTHGNTSQPSGSSSTDGTFARQTTAFTYGQAKWVTLSSAFGTDLKSGTAKGITLGRASGGTLAEYGYFATSAKLRITYEK